MTFPTLTESGTSRRVLMQQTMAAADALEIGISALADMAPNAADYPNEAALSEAQKEHGENTNRIRHVLNELYKRYNYIQGADGPAYEDDDEDYEDDF